MKESVKEYLHNEFIRHSMTVNLRHCSDVDMFCYFVYFKEGISLPEHIAMLFLEYAREILNIKEMKSEKAEITNRYNELMYRIDDLKSGEVNLADFMNGKEMAEWLKKGVLK